MKELEWRDEYLLGIPELDLQHEHIFNCFVTIAHEGSTKQERWHADSSMVQLVGLVQEHFTLEEGLMRILGYPEIEQHVKEHRQFRGEVYGLAQQSLRTKGGVSRELVKVAQKWLREHIRTSDRHYADYFAELMRSCVGVKKGAK